MKQGIPQLAVVTFSGLDLTTVEQITFYFKSTPDQDATILKKAVWKSDGTGDVTKDDDKFLITWAETDSYKLGQTLWIEPKVKIAAQDTMPEIRTQKIMITQTMIGESD